MLVLTVVGLWILTLGATSASFFGFDFGCPILELVDVESCQSGSDLRISCLGRVVVPGDLLGIFCLSAVFFFFFFGVCVLLSLVFGSVVFGSVAVDALEGMKYCG